MGRGQLDLELVDLTAPIADSAAQLDRACRELGFFLVPLSVVAADVANRAWDAAHRFFALPEATKRQVGFPEPGYPYGWSPFGFESLSASLDDAGERNGGARIAGASDGGERNGGARTEPTRDLKESYSVGPDCLGPASSPVDAGEAWIRSASLWPSEPADLRPAFTAYFRAQSDVAARLLSIMAVALDLPVDHFAGLIDRHTSALRALHYRAISAETPVGSLRAGAHSDYGTLTILRTDNVKGLEIRRPDGTWLEIVPRTDAFIVNLGDSIAQWTNDRWRSTVHRVTLVDPAPRYSLAFFHMAHWDATIECLPSCRSATEPARYPPVKAGPWLMRKFQSTVT